MIIKIISFDSNAMIVCHCMGITDRDLREAVRRGEDPSAGSAETPSQAGSCCGGCRPLVDEIVIRASQDIKQHRGD